MRLRAASLSALLLAGAIIGWPAGAFAGASGAAPARPSAPPELQALAQRMETLQVSSERISENMEVAGLGEAGPLGDTGQLFGKGHSHASPIPFIAISGEASASPHDASFEVTFLGISAQLRVIEGDEYVFDPTIASYDGGRPWVSSDPQERADQHLGVADLFSPVGFLQSTSQSSHPEPAGGPHGPFAGTLELIDRASNFEALGTTIVDGQAVSEFTATLDLRDAAGLELGGLENAASGTKPAVPFARVALFIAPNGVPVRTAVEAHRGRSGFSVRADVLAIDIPVVVESPPAAQTIALSEYGRIEHRRERRVLAGLRRRMRRQLAKLCRRARRRRRAHAPRGLCTGQPAK